MKLSIALRLAILTYYFNRSRQHKHRIDKIDGKYVTISEFSGFEWKKGKDVEAIYIAAQKSGLHARVSFGSFWFTRVRAGRKTVTYKTDENIFPLTEKV